jgi:hypothetical protein
VSIDVMDRVLAHSQSTGTDRVVLLVLARHDFGNGVFPSRRRIAKLANVSVKRVGEAFTSLIVLGELAREVRPGRSSRYAIKVECPDGCCEVGTPGVPTTDGGSAPQGFRGSAPQGCHVRVTEGNPSGLKDRKGRAGRQQPPSQLDPVAKMLEWVNSPEGTEVERDCGYPAGAWRRWLTQGTPADRAKGLRDVANERASATSTVPVDVGGEVDHAPI